MSLLHDEEALDLELRYLKYESSMVSTLFSSDQDKMRPHFCGVVWKRYLVQG